MESDLIYREKKGTACVLRVPASYNINGIDPFLRMDAFARFRPATI